MGDLHLASDTQTTGQVELEGQVWREHALARISRDSISTPGKPTETLTFTLTFRKLGGADLLAVLQVAFAVARSRNGRMDLDLATPSARQAPRAVMQ